MKLGNIQLMRKEQVFAIKNNKNIKMRQNIHEREGKKIVEAEVVILQRPPHDSVAICLPANSIKYNTYHEMHKVDQTFLAVNSAEMRLISHPYRKILSKQKRSFAHFTP